MSIVLCRAAQKTDMKKGTCPISSAQGPLTSLGGGDGAGQMQHFVTDDQMNIFRLRTSRASGGKPSLTYFSRIMAIFGQQQASRDA